MEKTDLSAMTDEQLRKLLFTCLSDRENLRRKNLIECCISHLNFTKAELNDTSTESPVVRAKSRIGMVLTAAVKSGYILEDDLFFLHLNSAELGFISREQGKDFVTGLLEKEGPLTKQQLFLRAEEAFGAAATPEPDDNNELRSVLGKVLQRLKDEKHIVYIAGKYKLAHDSKYPNTELGSYLRDAATGGNLKKCFLRAIHTKGGEWFEVYAVELLEKYFRLCGKEIEAASVTGGSDDGGIDGVIRTRDWLGFREQVLMQMKNRNAVMTAKDVREFYGAVCAASGSRGLFITISSFHIEARRLMDKVDNLIGIDGDMLFRIAEKCQHGILTVNGKLSLDEALFLNT